MAWANRKARFSQVCSRLVFEANTDFSPHHWSPQAQGPLSSSPSLLIPSPFQFVSQPAPLLSFFFHRLPLLTIFTQKDQFPDYDLSYIQLKSVLALVLASQKKGGKETKMERKNVRIQMSLSATVQHLRRKLGPGWKGAVIKATESCFLPNAAMF